MDKATQEMIDAVNILMKFNDNLQVIHELFPECHNDIDTLMPYTDYEIKKILKDIIHNERLV